MPIFLQANMLVKFKNLRYETNFTTAGIFAESVYICYIFSTLM